MSNIGCAWLLAISRVKRHLPFAICRKGRPFAIRRTPYALKVFPDFSANGQWQKANGVLNLASGGVVF